MDAYSCEVKLTAHVSGLEMELWLTLLDLSYPVLRRTLSWHDYLLLSLLGRAAVLKVWLYEAYPQYLPYSDRELDAMVLGAVKAFEQREAVPPESPARVM